MFWVRMLGVFCGFFFSFFRIWKVFVVIEIMRKIWVKRKVK